MIDLGTWTPDDPRCPVAIGEPGDDSRRCERDALPLHRSHLVAGVYYLPSNTDELLAGLREAYAAAGIDA